MKAMILAAGKGSRLKPLTDTCPKPLIPVREKPLIVYHIEKLKKIGITDIVINVHYLAEMLIKKLGTGKNWGVNICYSKEEILLETGGGICTALPLLGKDPFILINGDIWTDLDFSTLPTYIPSLAHLILVNNPQEHLQGDYTLSATGKVDLPNGTLPTYTYSGVAVLDPMLFEGCLPHQPFRLPLRFDYARFSNQLEGKYYNGYWTDVGNIERLQALEKRLSESK